MNLYFAIKHIYPDLNVQKDFSLRDDSDGIGPYIETWNADVPQPTEEELQQAWEEYQANPPEPPLSEMDTLGNQIVALELKNMSLQSQNDVLGEQIASMDIRMMMGGL